MGLSSKQVSETSTESLDHHHHHNWISGGTATTTTSRTSNNNNLLKRATSVNMKRNQHQQSAAQSEPLKCPRCESANTKFCYYNNYNRSQPRHFCRACKRHWTKGGTLRNVPVGGARKSNNKRPKKPKHSSAAAEARDDQDHNDNNNNKSVSEILYQAMMAPAPFPGPLAIPPPPPPAAALQLSAGSSPFHSSGSGPGSSHNLQVAATTNGMITPWQQLISNNYGSLDCGWNFEDFDSLVSADHIGLPWEDSLDTLKP